MNLLAIDTSTANATIALMSAGQIVSQCIAPSTEHARQLLPVIECLCLDLQLSIKQLNGIAFGKGPGSFTGLRVACSVAKGLAYATNCPLYPVGSLECMAYAAQHEGLCHDELILPMLDARMAQVYWALFSHTLDELVEPSVSNLDAVTFPDKPVVLVGDIKDAWLTQMKTSGLIKKPSILSLAPDAKTMLAMVASDRIKPVSVLDALPHYVRNKVTHGNAHG